MMMPIAGSQRRNAIGSILITLRDKLKQSTDYLYLLFAAMFISCETGCTISSVLDDPEMVNMLLYGEDGGMFP